MKEITDIIRSYEQAIVAGKKMALATVVHVEGSSYRRPGARMLVTDDGQLTGAISGGCLEGDALRKALLAISQQKNKLVTYDTTDDNDTTLGVQLGCNGIVHILFEPIQVENPENPVELLKLATAKRQRAVLITLFALHSRTAAQPGTCFLHLQNEDKLVNHCTICLVAGSLMQEAATAYENASSSFKIFDSAGQSLTAFIEYLETPPSLMVVGAGNDTVPLVEMAHSLGWQTTVIDGRAGHATTQRFPKANRVLVSGSEDVLNHIEIDERTFFMLMTHNYNYDLSMLKQLIFEDKCRYVGALGPKKKLEKMYDELFSQGIEVSEMQKQKVYGPIGLDLGAETSEEIALSVLAEIKAVLKGKKGSFLRDKIEPIHDRARQSLEYAKTEKEDFACAVSTAATE